MEQMAPSDRLAITDSEVGAYHAAGHAVAACLAGLRFQSVTLMPAPGRDGSKGFVAFLKDSWPAKSEMKVLFAGLFSEKRCLGEGWRLERSQCQDDVGRAQHLASALVDRDAALAEAYAQAEADIADRRVWQAVEAVAEALLVRGLLYEKDVRALVDAAMSRVRRLCE